MVGHYQRYEDSDTSGEQALPRPPASMAIAQIWDIGPQLPASVPKAPEHTATPSAWLDFETDASHHVALVLKYRRERAEWIQKHGGSPIRLELDHVSAREMIERGGGRYVSTLPSGLKRRQGV
jgi:hypothetical protein